MDEEYLVYVDKQLFVNLSCLALVELAYQLQKLLKQLESELYAQKQDS